MFFLSLARFIFSSFKRIGKSLNRFLSYETTLSARTTTKREEAKKAKGWKCHFCRKGWALHIVFTGTTSARQERERRKKDEEEKSYYCLCLCSAVREGEREEKKGSQRKLFAIFLDSCIRSGSTDSGGCCGRKQKREPALFPEGNSLIETGEKPRQHRLILIFLKIGVCSLFHLESFIYLHRFFSYYFSAQGRQVALLIVNKSSSNFLLYLFAFQFRR